MTKSAGYIRIFLIAIAFIWGCNADTPKPAEEKKHIDNSSNVLKQKANDDFISAYANEKHKKDRTDSVREATKIKEAKKPRLDFSAKINEKMPEFNFKIIGKIKGVYFQPSHVEISDTTNGKLIQKLIAKNHFDNEGEGWEADETVNFIKFIDLNNDRYLDVMIFKWAGATGNSGWAIYLYHAESGKFKFHKLLSDLSAVHVNANIITSYSRSGWCYESIGYYSLTGDKLALLKIEWTEMDRTRDEEVGGPACFKYSGIPRYKNVMITPDDFIVALYDNRLQHLRNKLKNIKEEPLYGSLDRKQRGPLGNPMD
jgi:hypothetical protein